MMEQAAQLAADQDCNEAPSGSHITSEDSRVDYSVLHRYSNPAC